MPGKTTQTEDATMTYPLSCVFPAVNLAFSERKMLNVYMFQLLLFRSVAYRPFPLIKGELR